MPNEKESYNPSADSDAQPPHQSPAIPPTPLQGALSSDSEGKANSAKSEADELAREFRAAEKWVIGTNIALAIVGIVALVIYNGQLREMRKTTKATITAANAAKSAADTARDTLTNSQEQFRVEERPWIITRDVPADPQQSPIIVEVDSANKPTGFVFLNVRVEVRNIGKTPAMKTHMSHPEYIKGPLSEVRDKIINFKPNYGTGTGGFLAPSPDSGVIPATERGSNRLATADFEKVKAMKWGVYIMGGIQYTDVFKPEIPPYETTYCYVYHPTGIPWAECGSSIK